ncbi:MAG: P-loop NTPase [Spirochaetes bacterium]|nr:P-loop NTPase [Spirochaetota bacterium]
MVICENVDRKIIPIASGKGGVGKTVLAANLALALADGGRKTIAVDLDLGGSNLHTCLGIKNINPGVGNLLADKSLRFKDLLLRTRYHNLMFVPGDVLVPGLSEIIHVQRKRIVKQLLSIDADYLILDLGSGTSDAVLDFFLVSNCGILVTTPQPTAVTNAYGFFKNLVFRFLRRALSGNKKVSEYLISLGSERAPQSSPTVPQILSRLNKIDKGKAQAAQDYLSMLHPKLVINFSHSPDDTDAGLKIRDLCKKNLNIDMECIGLIGHNGAVDKSVADRVPLLRFEPDSVAALQIGRIAGRILSEPGFPLCTSEASFGKKSFDLVREESHQDFLNKSKADMPDVNDLMQVIEGQKRQIDDLRGTVRILTLRNM